MMYGEVMHAHKGKGALDLQSQDRDKVYWNVMAGPQCTYLPASSY
jgi:hypothetical protein